VVPAGANGADPIDRKASSPLCVCRIFSLFYATRYGFLPSKIAYLAWNAWA